MLTIPQYLLESSFCLAIFYGFYHLFLKKETFFQLNRAYLLATPIMALSIPLLNISFQKDAPPESLEAFFYPAIQSANNLNEVVWEQMRAPSPVFSLSVADVIMAIYLVGIFLMSFSLLKGLWNLGRLIRHGKRSKNKEFTLVETQNNFPAASFFGYIFWNQQITDEQKLILEHEKVHIRQWHSLDVLLMEICVIIKWFNPLIYWFRNALKATHEFIADQYVIQQKSNVSDYATLLVNQHKQQIATPLTNTFYSMTKKRLQMMIQKPSQTVYAAKYLFVFPLIIGMMGLFSFNLLEEIPQVSEGLSEMNSVIDDIGGKAVFEINQPTSNDLISASESAVKEHQEVLAKTFEEKWGLETDNKYQLFWGSTEIPVGYHDKEDVSIMNYDMELKDFIKMVRQPISFKKLGTPFIPEELVVTVYGKDIMVIWSIHPENMGKKDYLKELVLGGIDEDVEAGTPIPYVKPESEPIKIAIDGKEKMIFSEEEYEQIFNLIDGKLTVNIQTMDDYLIATSIHVTTPTTAYQPPHKIIAKEKEIYNFQLITPIEGRPILKIDTIKSAKTARLFRDKSKYKIIHIPNFQTIERTIDEKEPNKDSNSKNVRPILYNSITDADLLPNYIIEAPTALVLTWGNLKAAPESENLSLKDFYVNQAKIPQLIYKDTALPFSKIRLTIIGDKLIYSKSVTLADFGTPQMAEILNKVDSKTSLYFDKIELVDNGVTKHLQHRFLFKVGNQVLKSPNR